MVQLKTSRFLFSATDIYSMLGCQSEIDNSQILLSVILLVDIRGDAADTQVPHQYNHYWNLHKATIHHFRMKCWKCIHNIDRGRKTTRLVVFEKSKVINDGFIDALDI
ncbi:hypothetical protein T02_7341 [Trichinella nativa]|uniref:Uncharacterized protein n=1 Tax=Trichinella nativa TaxID=6335 RepID=A0A0V1LJV7_9BILA|nr:hypothetical protein T02_7341 [Trichinella nativa]